MSNYKEMSIKAFLEDHGALKPGRVAIKGKIVSAVKVGLFTFADTSGNVQVKSSPAAKYVVPIVPGNYIKIVNPERGAEEENCLILTGKSIVQPTRKIKELKDLEAHALDSQNCPTLASLANLEPQMVRLSNVSLLSYLQFHIFNFSKCLKSE